MRFWFFGILFTWGIGLFGQLSTTGDVQLRWGESKNHFNYTETLLNLNANWGRTFSWLQFEFSDPPELGKRISGLRKIRIEYRGERTQIEVGDLYKIWGRGLILNQLDDQAIDLDNGLTGVGFTYQTKRFQGQIIAGNQDIYKSTNLVLGFNDRIPNYTMHHSLFGVDLLKHFPSSSLGYSFLQSRERHPIPFNQYYQPDTLPLVHRLQSLRIEMIKSRFDTYLEYVTKTTHESYQSETFLEQDSLVSEGRGFFANLNFYLGSWSFSLDYKNYRFAQLEPLKRWDFVNNYGGRIDFQKPPTAIFEHATHLLNRITHQVDFADEVGYQLELQGPFFGSTTLLLHYAQASRTASWRSTPQFVWSSEKRNPLLPLVDPAANPFKEIYAEIEGYANDDAFHYLVAGAYTRDVPTLGWHVVTDTSERWQYELIEGFTYPTFFEYYFSNGWSVELKGEYQILTKGLRFKETGHGTVLVDSLLSNFIDDKGHSVDYQVNTFFSLGIGKSPTWSVVLIIDAISAEEGLSVLANNKENPLESLMSHIISIDRKWISVELLLNLTPTHRLTLMYGSQQGGLVCSNGVCRIIQPFEDGFKLTLSAIF